MLRIKELCKERGISMQVLAEKRLGITNQAFYASINGNPTLERLKQIADALDVDVVDLFERSAPAEGRCPHCGGALEIEVKIAGEK